MFSKHNKQPTERRAASEARNNTIAAIYSQILHADQEIKQVKDIINSIVSFTIPQKQKESRLV